MPDRVIDFETGVAYIPFACPNGTHLSRGEGMASISSGFFRREMARGRFTQQDWEIRKRVRDRWLKWVLGSGQQKARDYIRKRESVEAR